MNADPIADNLTAHYHAKRIAAHLRETADRIEGQRLLPNIRDGHLDHGRAAADIVHKTQAAFGNLPLEALLMSAMDADRYLRNPDGTA